MIICLAERFLIIIASSNSPQPWLGKRSLADICQQHNLSIPIILRGFADRDIEVSADMSIKKIAEKTKISPIDVYEVIKDIAGEK